ncbi:alpha-ketoacid dehydrogenase subunit beta [Mycoplasma todarodis]|uniref:Alpha-ketoacid dehydrogenase subunit beta n=1 Tax=Mycoplasma todarodis TaxID=1937191 RepID=A0A4R0XT87_9MOLU|nr:alpha-ketoacid dehydrogenase subunit beta [Mycoplasma todarodis]TCG10957.1 alpha-ketoacid dehydrogenase subunit beta [Mycoplasma todarodis]
MAKLNNIEALTNALEVAMEADERIVIFGEDAGFEGGVFRATQGLQKKFGEDRVFDAPISEATIVGTGVGLAIAGMKPVVEMQFQGFSYAGLQQLFTHAARIRNRSRGRFSCPLIVRMPMGGGVRALEHHSESIEAIFAHIPGVKVVMPSNPYDMKGMMLAALKEDDPVVFLESKKIYRAFKQEVPEGMYKVELGKANVIKEGESVTVVTYGAQVHDSIKAVEELMQTNPEIDVELIDLRTISPIDTETLVNSIKKTGRMIIVHEAVKSFSVSSEIMARVSEKAFEYLEAPISRVTGYDITIPLATGEKHHMVDSKKIAEKIKEVVAFKA